MYGWWHSIDSCGWSMNRGGEGRPCAYKRCCFYGVLRSTSYEIRELIRVKGCVPDGADMRWYQTRDESKSREHIYSPSSNQRAGCGISSQENLSGYHRFGALGGTVVIDSRGVPFPLDMAPILGIPRPARPLPLLGLPPTPPCQVVNPPKPYPKGALSLLALLLDFFPCPVRPPNPGPDAVPGDDKHDTEDIPSAPGPEQLFGVIPGPSSFEMRCRLLLILPDTSHPALSSNRSMVAEPGEGGIGDGPSPRGYATCWKLCCRDSGVLCCPC